MNFCLEIGETERHRLEYNSDGFSGSFAIKVDDHEVRSARRLLVKPLKETHDLEIGGNERLNVTIQTLRNTLLGEKTCVYVNGRLVKLYET